MDETITTEAQTVAALTAAGMAVREIAGTPILAIPDGYLISELAHLLPQPTRKRGTFQVRDLASFLAVVNKHKDAATEIYRSVEPPRFLAVFNAHQGADKPTGWGDFRADYVCPVSAEWKAWLGGNKRQMTQEQFAQFIEDNLPDMVQPPAADMLEISRTLQAKKKVNFASGIRLSNGENQLTYEEKVEGSAGARGHLKVPEVFTIGIPVFEGGDRYAVNARLRYRIGDGGSLAMWYDLERPHKILEDAVKNLDAAVTAGTGLTSINGSPA